MIDCIFKDAFRNVNNSPSSHIIEIPCPCINGGVCLPDNFTTFSEIMCSCPENYTGERCQWCEFTLSFAVDACT